MIRHLVHFNYVAWQPHIIEPMILEGKLHITSVVSWWSNVMDYICQWVISIALTLCISVIFGDLDKHTNAVGDYMNVHRIFNFSQQSIPNRYLHG